MPAIGSAPKRLRAWDLEMFRTVEKCDGKSLLFSQHRRYLVRELSCSLGQLDVPFCGKQFSNRSSTMLNLLSRPQFSHISEGTSINRVLGSR